MRHLFMSSILLGLFAVVATGVVLFVYDKTRHNIKKSEQDYLLGQLHEIIKPHEHDNELQNDTVTITDRYFLNSAGPVTGYRAKLAGRPVAIIFPVTAPDGYNGNIKLLVGIYTDGTLAGVRVIAHKETPGLGDAIEKSRSDWIETFSGKSLDNTSEQHWRVKKQGGQFDQFTGATITPRAVVRAVNNALKYFNKNSASLLGTAPDIEPGTQ